MNYVYANDTAASQLRMLVVFNRLLELPDARAQLDGIVRDLLAVLGDEYVAEILRRCVGYYDLGNRKRFRAQLKRVMQRGGLPTEAAAVAPDPDLDRRLTAIIEPFATRWLWGVPEAYQMVLDRLVLRIMEDRGISPVSLKALMLVGLDQLSRTSKRSQHAHLLLGSGRAPRSLKGKRALAQKDLAGFGFKKRRTHTLGMWADSFVRIRVLGVIPAAVACSLDKTEADVSRGIEPFDRAFGICRTRGRPPIAKR